jgi:hypothetical protein
VWIDRRKKEKMIVSGEGNDSFCAPFSFSISLPRSFTARGRNLCERLLGVAAMRAGSRGRGATPCRPWMRSLRPSPSHARRRPWRASTAATWGEGVFSTSAISLSPSLCLSPKTIEMIMKMIRMMSGPYERWVRMAEEAQAGRDERRGRR